MFGGLMFVIAGMSASLAQNSSTGTENSSLVATASSQRFSQCPDSYTNFCFHGTCRFLITEWEPSCLCTKGYMGSRCEYMDLLQVMTDNPRSFVVVVLSVIFLIVLTMIGTTCLSLYFCRLKRDRDRLTLLNNIEVNDV